MSLYFDSPALRFYDEKLEGEMLRNKVRLRGYGYDWRGMDPCFLEVKRKIDSRVVKFRKNLGPFRPEYWEPERWQLGEGPKEAPVAFLARLHNLRPAVQVLYQREAWESPYCPRLRIAFDSQLVALHPGEQPWPGMFDDRGRRLMTDTQFIFEVKADHGLPDWVYRALHSCQVELQSISKYVLAIEKLNLHNREVGVYA
jgi:hypothetical protein